MEPMTTQARPSELADRLMNIAQEYKDNAGSRYLGAGDVARQKYAAALTPILEALTEARRELANAGGDVARFKYSDSDSRRGRECQKVVDSIHAKLDAALALLQTEGACSECGGTGAVNSWDGKDTGSNTAENWPAPCPKCNGGHNG